MERFEQTTGDEEIIDINGRRRVVPVRGDEGPAENSEEKGGDP